MKKLKPFTVVGTCTCGCDNHEAHWTRARTGTEAAEKVQRRLAGHPIDTERELDIVAVFRGHLRNQGS